jgi:outer membrane protein OmpA-like peptidoglycan-associated protein
VLAQFCRFFCAILLFHLKRTTMAEIEVEPKKQNSGSILPWLLLGLGVIALLFFLFRNGNDDDRNDQARTTEQAGTYSNTGANAAAGGAGWNAIDRNAPERRHEEIRGNNVSVRGNDDYSIYGLGENILFDTDAATIRPGAEEDLRQVAQSINQRYQGGEVRVYGFTDDRGTPGYNEQLSTQRAEAVRNWLSQHGNIDAARISVEPQGESNPQATNETAAGRQQNRRVEIAARKGN